MDAAGTAIARERENVFRLRPFLILSVTKMEGAPPPPAPHIYNAAGAGPGPASGEAAKSEKGNKQFHHCFLRALSSVKTMGAS